LQKKRQYGVSRVVLSSLPRGTITPKFSIYMATTENVSIPFGKFQIWMGYQLNPFNKSCKWEGTIIAGFSKNLQEIIKGNRTFPKSFFGWNGFLLRCRGLSRKNTSHSLLHEKRKNPQSQCNHCGILSRFLWFSQKPQSGWTHYGILSRFYYLLKIDLLKVVHESKHSRKILGSFNSTHLALVVKKKEA